MMPLEGLAAASRAFAAEAVDIDPEAAVSSEIWPTAGRIVDHLGSVQAWATEVVRTGHLADRRAFGRPEGRDRVEWFTQASSALQEVLREADPERACWTLFDAAPVTSFWMRRMPIEATKHLWDLRTAVDPTPPMPPELSLAQQADVIDEFVDVFVAAARTRGIEALPRDVVMLADDLDRGWRFTSDWRVTEASEADAGTDADILRADVGDLGLFVWERARPWDLPDRYRFGAEDEAIRAFARTPVHL